MMWVVSLTMTYILSFYARCARRIPESGTRFAHRLCAGLREGDRKDLYAV